MIQKTISVWLILKDGRNKGKAVLQKRSIKEHSFPHICQATWAGKVEPGEKEEAAVARECKEELGEKFFNDLKFSDLKLISKESFTNSKGKWQSYNYFAKVKEKLILLAEIHSDALEEFIFVGKGDDFYPLSVNRDPEKEVVLFDDQYKVLKSILNGN